MTNLIDFRSGPWASVKRICLPTEPTRSEHRAVDAGFARFASRFSLAHQIAKRSVDVIGSLFLIALFSPIMSATYLILLVSTRGKPLYWQRRLGHFGKPFWMAKFRTMVVDAEKRRHLISNEADGPVFKNRRDPRITPFGRVLRKFSIDETPQLFNVLLGTMSLVGPRPPIPGEVDLYEPWQCERLSVKPGLTCIWQVEGRSDIPFTDWVRLDIRYARNCTLSHDLRILMRTPWAVVTGRGAY